MLAVGAGLTEDDGACLIADRLAEAVDGLAVGLHIQLLQMCGEAGQGLGIRQDRGAQIAFDVALVSADQGIQQSRVLADIGIEGSLVGLSRAVHDTREDLGAEGQGEDHSADAGRGGIAAADVVIHEEGFQIV